MKKYTTLYFDLDNTLLDFTKSEHTAIKKLLSQYSLPSNNKIAKVYSDINRTFWEAFERGDIKKEEIYAGRFKKLLDVLKESRDTEAMARDYFGFLSCGYDLVDNAIDILSHLKQGGYKIYATTNGVAFTQYKRIKNSGLEPYFDAVFVSEEAGHQKPEKAYFDFVLANTEEKDKNNILIIGDSQSSDILGGINAGIDTCWYNPTGAEAKYSCTYKIGSLLDLKKILL